MSVANMIPVTAPAPVLPRRRQLLFATGLAVGFWVILNMTLVGEYLQKRGGDRVAWLKEHPIPLTQPNMQMGTLVFSVFMVQWAVHAIRKDDRGHAYLALGITLVLGLAFINQTWFLLTQIGLPMGSAEGPTFYAVIGTHLAMMACGLIYVALMGLRALGGSFSSRHPDGLSAAALFWHATVAMYSVIWLAVYIAK